MRTVLVLLCLMVAGPAWADQFVNGYYRQDGTYVQPHFRSSPDRNPYNNWSVKPNVNPYTGVPGARNVPTPYMGAQVPRYPGTLVDPYGRQYR